MELRATPGNCPKCGAAVPDGAAAGLCPACLLAAASIPTDAGPASGRHQPRVPGLEQVSAAFPQWEIVECIGAGGMGAVFKARQPRLDRWVALKLLPEALADEPEFTERFEREARTLARLSHPGIVTVHDFGRAGGFHYLVMEYVDGVNLRQAMRAGRFTPAQALGLVPRICEALQYAHDAGVTHRDIKPENILLDASGRVKIADFGIARLLGEPSPEGALTATGSTLGTPQYMAPEQIERPSEVDHRADIYSLGVVLYELLTGELPLGRFAPPSDKIDLDARVDAIVLRALTKERELRQQTAGEMQTEVEGVTTAPRRPGPTNRSDLAAPPPAGRPWNLPAAQKGTLLALWGVLLGLEVFHQTTGWLWSWRLFLSHVFVLNPGHWTTVGGSPWQWVTQTVALAVVAGLGAWAGWSRRATWLAAFPNGLPDACTSPADRRLNAGLRIAIIATVGCATAAVAWSLLLHAAHIGSNAVWTWVHVGSWWVFLGTWLLFTMPIWSILLPLGFLVWREGRRCDLVPPGPIPPWAHRVAAGILFFATLASLHALPRQTDGPRLVMMVAPLWAALVPVALWTRSRLWRAAALSLNGLALGMAIVGILRLAVFAPHGSPGAWALPDAWPPPFVVTHPGTLMVLGLGAALAPLAGLLALMSPEVRRSFGLPPRGTRSTSPNSEPAGNATAPVSVGRESRPTPLRPIPTPQSGISKREKALVVLGLVALLVVLAPGTQRMAVLGMDGRLENATSPDLPWPQGWWFVLVACVVGGLLRSWWRGDRRQPGPAPAWMRRFGIELAVAGLVCTLAGPGLARQSPSTIQVAFNTSVLLFLPAIALLTRGPYWRAVALSVGLAVISMEVVVRGWLALQGGPGAFLPTTLQGTVPWIVLVLHIAGATALLLPSARAAFGIPSRTRSPRSPRSPQLPHAAGAA